jgi:GPN-loop GTPase
MEGISYTPSAPPVDNAGTSTAAGSTANQSKKPTVIITIGMAGAGKSTFVQRINAHLHGREPPSPPYILNLDPAVANVPFEANIDIRDTVDYHEVMKQCVSHLVPPFSLFTCDV